MKKLDIIDAYTMDLKLVQLKRKRIQIDIVLNCPVVFQGMIHFFDKTNTCLFAHEMLGKYDPSSEIYVENDEIFREILEKFKEQFLQNYVYNDVSYVYKARVIN